MPELPEVETVRRGMVPYLENQTVSRVILRRPDLRRPFPDDLSDRLTGARLLTLRRRSKYILIDTDRADTVLMHLGMSGRVLLYAPDDACGPAGAHDHVEWHLTSGARMVFADPRRFGMMTVFASADEERHDLLVHLGPEPLSNQFSPAVLARRMSGRASPVKAVLLDQKTVAGLGNIYVCEALWRAGIHPRRQAGRIGRARTERLYQAIRSVLEEAIASGGSTLRDHVGLGGELGYFQHRFDVYNREGEACRRDGCGGDVRRMVQSGRSTFYCQRCQR